MLRPADDEDVPAGLALDRHVSAPGVRGESPRAGTRAEAAAPDPPGARRGARAAQIVEDAGSVPGPPAVPAEARAVPGAHVAPSRRRPTVELCPPRFGPAGRLSALAVGRPRLSVPWRRACARARFVRSRQRRAPRRRAARGHVLFSGRTGALSQAKAQRPGYPCQAVPNRRRRASGGLRSCPRAPTRTRLQGSAAAWRRPGVAGDRFAARRPRRVRW